MVLPPVSALVVVTTRTGAVVSEAGAVVAAAGGDSGGVVVVLEYSHSVVELEPTTLTGQLAGGISPSLATATILKSQLSANSPESRGIKTAKAWVGG